MQKMRLQAMTWMLQLSHAEAVAVGDAAEATGVVADAVVVVVAVVGRVAVAGASPPQMMKGTASRERRRGRRRWRLQKREAELRARAREMLQKPKGQADRRQLLPLRPRPSQLKEWMRKRPLSHPKRPPSLVARTLLVPLPMPRAKTQVMVMAQTQSLALAGKKMLQLSHRRPGNPSENVLVVVGVVVLRLGASEVSLRIVAFSAQCSCHLEESAAQADPRAPTLAP